MKSRLTDKLKNSIELTSLLDVIFIILMVVVCNQQINMQEKTSEAERVMIEAQQMQDAALQMQDEASIAISDKKLYQEQLDTLENADQLIGSITVRVDYMPSEPQNRTIKILSSTGEQTIDLTPANTAAAYERMEEQLEKAITENAGKPVFIAVEDKEILYRDLNMTSDIVDGLMDLYDNVYRKKGTDSAD